MVLIVKVKRMNLSAALGIEIHLKQEEVLALGEMEKKWVKKSWGSQEGKLASLGKGHGSITFRGFWGDADKVGRALQAKQ